MDFPWPPAHPDAFAAYASLIIGFLLYLYLYLSPGVRRWLARQYGEEGLNQSWVVMTKLAGFVLLGVIPAMIIVLVLQKPLSDFGAAAPHTAFSWQWMIGGSLLVLLVNWLQGRRPQHYGTYPLIRKKRWTPRLLLLSLSTSALFIIGYEFMFRGFLLFASVPIMGVWLAVLVNILVYALAHIHKGLTETIGSIPFGLLLCWITLQSGNFWAIMAMHITLSLSADLVALYFNPEMKWAGMNR